MFLITTTQIQHSGNINIKSTKEIKPTQIMHTGWNQNHTTNSLYTNQIGTDALQCWASSVRILVKILLLDKKQENENMYFAAWGQNGGKINIDFWWKPGFGFA